MNRIFEVLGKNENYIEFHRTAPHAATRARTGHATGPASLKRHKIRHKMALLRHFGHRYLFGYQELAYAICD